jgi:uncharacterized protein YabE (DUF348 family)
MNKYRVASVVVIVLLFIFIGIPFYLQQHQTKLRDAVLAADNLNFAVKGISTDPSIVSTTSVPIGEKPEIYQGSFFYTTSAQMLKSLGVNINPEDKVVAFPDPSLGLGSRLEVYRAQPVLISDGDNQTLVRTWAKTVGDLLNEQRISLGSQDYVQPNQQTILPLGGPTFSVKVVRVSETNLVVSTLLPFSVIKQNDANLLVGVNQVSQNGSVGRRDQTYSVRRENGVEVSRTLLSDQVAVAPVNEIILVGTKPKVQLLSQGEYMSLINAAAQQYNVSAVSIYRTMLCESGGNIYSENPAGPYIGLFQYSKPTWDALSGGQNIYDPKAQIFVTAANWNHRYNLWPNCAP